MKKRSDAALGAGAFYDAVADFYGQMIDFEKNLELRISAYQRIFPVRGAVADLGCGIGLDALALAKNGHAVTAFDISPKMIEQTKACAARHGLAIEVRVCAYEKVPKRYNGSFSGAVCVGNAIAHIDAGRLRNAVCRMHGLLAPGGKLLLHILNYGLVTRGSRIKNIANRGGRIIIRAYDIDQTDLNFNILSFPVNSPKDFQLVTTKHYPHTRAEIYACLQSAGFVKIKAWKNFNGDRFSARDSKDLFIEAIKRR